MRIALILVRWRRDAVVDSGECDSAGGCYLNLQGGGRLHTNQLWLATGTDSDVYALRCLQPLLADVATIEGFPLLNDQLRLGPHPAFLMGRPTMLTLGPAAGNLWGAQRAAHRIALAITGVDVLVQRRSWKRQRLLNN